MNNPAWQAIVPNLSRASWCPTSRSRWNAASKTISPRLGPALGRLMVALSSYRSGSLRLSAELGLVRRGHLVLFNWSVSRLFQSTLLERIAGLLRLAALCALRAPIFRLAAASSPSASLSGIWSLLAWCEQRLHQGRVGYGF